MEPATKISLLIAEIIGQSWISDAHHGVRWYFIVSTGMLWGRRR